MVVKQCVLKSNATYQEILSCARAAAKFSEDNTMATSVVEDALFAAFRNMDAKQHRRVAEELLGVLMTNYPDLFE